MAIVKPFKGLRTPSQEVCEELACLPYDVMNSEEAAQMAAGKPRSLLHVTRAEIDCPAGTDIHSETCLLYTSPSPRDLSTSRMPSSA